MEVENLFNDSIEYTHETFAGRWGRWLIFVLLSLPFSLVRFVVDPQKIFADKTIHWELIPWGSIAILIIAGVLASFFITGYIVRIYRGTRPAPDFTGWVSLFTDGIKLDIVMLVWFLPAIVLALAGLIAIFGGLIWPGLFPRFGSSVVLLLAGIILVVVAMVLLIIAALYVSMAVIRFARTGSMAEGWRYSAIAAIIRRIGWWNYFVALIIIAFVSFIFSLLVSIPAFIPYIGWIVPLGLSPLLTVFSARYFTLVYEAGEAPPPAPPV